MSYTNSLRDLQSMIQYFVAHVEKLEQEYPGALEKLHETLFPNVTEGQIQDMEEWLVGLMKCVNFIFHKDTVYASFYAEFVDDQFLRWDKGSCSWIPDESEDKTIDYPC
jgi:hypothetical protein